MLVAATGPKRRAPSFLLIPNANQNASKQKEGALPLISQRQGQNLPTAKKDGAVPFSQRQADQPGEGDLPRLTQCQAPARPKTWTAPSLYANAKRRLADEYDEAQRAGEVRGPSDRRSGSRAEPNKVGYEELGLSRKEIHEARLAHRARRFNIG